MKPRSLRLLFLLPHLLTDGPSRQWSLLVPALVEQGHRASVLTLDDEGRFFDELRSQGLPIACAAMRRRSDLRRLRQALGVVCPVAPDVIVTHGPGPQLFGQVLAWRWRVPHVTVEHRAPELPLRGYQEVLVRMVAPHLRTTIAISQKQLPRLLRRGCKPDRIRVIPNGVSPAMRPTRPRALVRSALGLGDGDFVALLASMLRREKCPEVFVEAVVRANRIDGRIRGIVAGSGSELGRVRQLANQHGGIVRVLGHRTDIADLMGAADVVCQSSIAECLPTSLLEAMACGRPVVATAVGATDEVVVHGETGLLVRQNDEAGLAAALVRLATEPGLARAYGEAGNARQRDHFSLERMRDEYALAFSEACAT